MDRMTRVAQLLQEEIANMIIGREVKDPRVGPLLSISGVEVSRDLAYARVLVSGYLSEKKLEKGVEGLNNAAGFLQSKLARRVRLKSTPRLRFFVDHSVERAFEVTQTIDSLSESASEHSQETEVPYSEGKNDE